VRPVLAYAPRPGPLGRARPWIAAVFLMPYAIVAFSFSDPIVLAAAGAAALAAGYASGARDSLRQPLRWSLTLGLMVVAVNAIVSQRGATILLRGWDLPVVGQVDVSGEALAEGGVLALRIVVALLVFAVWSACVDPDRVLRAIRPLAGRSALTATLISRMVPLAAADANRLSEAGRLRGPAAAPLGRAPIARRLIAGSLDRSVDIAATLELRGYGLGIRTRRPRHRPEPGEGALLAAGVACLAVMLAAAIQGLGQFDAYPRTSLDTDLATLGFAALLPLCALAPFAWRLASWRSPGARLAIGADDA
jgi:energy-coupling factor transport system permease protein